MHLIAIAITAATSISPSLAIPGAAAAKAYTWSVTKWSFCHGQSVYDYSFTVKGAQNGGIPAFKATCSGTQQGGYKACTSANGVSVSANVNIVTDPNDPNDNIPRVFVQMNYVYEEGCRYTSTGHYDATLNCGSTTGRKFLIMPKDVAIC